MQILIEEAPSLELHSQIIRSAWQQICPALAAGAGRLHINRGEDIGALACASRSIFVLVEGTATLTSDSQSLLCFEAGDVIGFEQFMVGSRSVLSSEFAVKVESYPLESVLTKIREGREYQDAWNSILSYYGDMWRCVAQHCAAKLSIADEQMPPRVQHFNQGETIIQEGAESSDVYTLIDGGADAFVAGVKVGEIHPDEIFGAIAAIAGVPRTAAIVATKRSMALTIPKSDFLHLLKTRPATVMRLIQDMARALANANERVVGAVSLR